MFNVTLRQLSHFVLAARVLSIAKAASELRLSQSAIAYSIGRLEEEVGLTLFMRRPAKGLKLTADGRKIFKLSNEFLETYSSFQESIFTSIEAETGEISVGCFSASAPYFMPSIINGLRDHYPGIVINLHEGDLEEVQDMLLDGKIDVLLSYDLQILPELEREALSEIPPHAVEYRKNKRPFHPTPTADDCCCITR